MGFLGLADGVLFLGSAVQRWFRVVLSWTMLDLVSGWALRGFKAGQMGGFRAPAALREKPYMMEGWCGVSRVPWNLISGW